MDAQAAKFIGAGLACFALIGAGIGIGNIFGNYLSGALRNPSAAPGQFTNLLIGFALGVAITVGAMGLMANAALVLSYLTLSVSVAAGSVSLLCWRG